MRLTFFIKSLQMKSKPYLITLCGFGNTISQHGSCEYVQDLSEGDCDASYMIGY